MVTLQELITRGRFVMADSPERLKTFQAIDGKRTAAEIAQLTGRHVNNIRRDLRALENVELIQHKSDGKGGVTSGGLPVWEKVPLAREIAVHYFESTGKRPAKPSVPDINSSSGQKEMPRRAGHQDLTVPSETEVLSIAKEGEDQIYEFKAQGTDVRKLCREIAAMLNTRRGGIILYGVDDDGNIIGSDVSRQKLDQPLQNSLKNSISPAATIQLKTLSVLGTDLIAIIVPPWNKRDVYQFDEKILIRKGTNVFGAKPEEVKQLHKGQYVI